MKVTIQTDIPATDSQVRLIARLCTILRIKDPLEEKPMSMAEAGKLINKLIRQVKGG
ncbi:MAG: hypothetical protein V1709_06430 [Planctomycetota bacterium]